MCQRCSETSNDSEIQIILTASCYNQNLTNLVLGLGFRFWAYGLRLFQAKGLIGCLTVDSPKRPKDPIIRYSGLG